MRVSRHWHCGWMLIPVIAGGIVASARADQNPLTIATGRQGAWMAEHETHKQKARASNFDVVFLGDSITERWRYPAEGRSVWDKRLAPLNAGEFGISGDGTQSVLWRLQDGELGGLHPKVVVLLIGTNHIQSSQPDQIAEGITAVVHDLRRRLPSSKILLMGLFPRKHSTDPPDIPAHIREVNAQIARLDDNGRSVRYLDLGPRFLNPNGSLISDTMIDGLHLSPKGYEIWADGVMMPIAELMRTGGHSSGPSADDAALRFRPKLRPDTLVKLREVAKNEPVGGEGRIFHVATLYTHDPKADRKALKEELFKYAETGTPEEKFQSLLTIGKWAERKDLARLEPMLSDADTDVRIASAHAILTILKRSPAPAGS
jgi:lysophospholipase L1-like esterase